jgi:hypothetical protein
MEFAVDAGNYGNLWVLKRAFGERLGLELTIAKRNPRDKHTGLH